MNYKHLHYFWTVARSGSVVRASERLHLTPQTLSAQIKLLERSLGTNLFRPAGRGIELTEAGRLALGYADEIFALGHALETALSKRQGMPAQPFRVGITDVVPKSLAYRFLSQVRRLPEQVRLICREGKLDRLLAELGLHKLDLVIADRPIPERMHVRGDCVRLGSSRLAFFAAPRLAERYGNFPECLDDAPLYLPGDDATVRGRIERWLEEHRLAPRVLGEFDDGALLKAFGQEGGAIFPAAAILADELVAKYGLVMIGMVNSLHEEFYAITREAGSEEPVVQAIMDSARQVLSGRAQDP